MRLAWSLDVEEYMLMLMIIISIQFQTTGGSFSLLNLYLYMSCATPSVVHAMDFAVYVRLLLNL